MRQHLCGSLLLAGMGLFACGFGQAGAQGQLGHTLPSSQKAAALSETYTRIKQHTSENQSAVLSMQRLRASRLHFHLTALWWSVGHASSPHNGEIEATIPLHNQSAVYTNGNYRLTMRFRDQKVVLTESGSNPDFGAYVRAAGTYRRAR